MSLMGCDITKCVLLRLFRVIYALANSSLGCPMMANSILAGNATELVISQMSVRTVCFNCEELRHESRDCEEDLRCCICKSTTHLARFCHFSWYKSTPPPPSACPSINERLSDSRRDEVQHADENPPNNNAPPSVTNIDPPETGPGATLVESQLNTDDLNVLEINSPMLCDSLASDATVSPTPGDAPSVIGDSSPPSANPDSGDTSVDPPVHFVDSKGFLVSQPEPSDLPEHPTNVLPSDLDPPTVDPSTNDYSEVVLSVSDGVLHGELSYC